MFKNNSTEGIFVNMSAETFRLICPPTDFSFEIASFPAV